MTQLNKEEEALRRMLDSTVREPDPTQIQRMARHAATIPEQAQRNFSLRLSLGVATIALGSLAAFLITSSRSPTPQTDHASRLAAMVHDAELVHALESAEDVQIWKLEPGLFDLSEEPDSSEDQALWIAAYDQILSQPLDKGW